MSNGFWLMCLSVFLFSISIILIKVANERFAASTWTITMIRFAMGWASVTLLFRAGQKADLRSIFTQKGLILRGVLGGLSVLLHNLCIAQMGAGRATVLMASFPIFAALIAFPMLGEPIRLKQFIYSFFAICGIAIMTGSDGLASGINPYDLLAIGVAILSGWVVTIIRKLHEKENTATIFVSQCVWGILICGPFFFQSGPLPDLAGLSVVLLSSAFVVLAQLAMTQAYKSVSVSLGSSIHLVGPALVTLLSFGFLGERLGRWDIIGAVIILAACWKIVRIR